ncbi:hypothetical protein ACFPDQ_06960 [Pseudofrancisella aestuarii]|uniref:Secreted protein n=1 Tax=Pseudofrancisella aestuarii TaxID=2670347 RepID=A0ABV9TC88_9GAMM|nr:hypothetical protein [Pseudofrancisella aestuarii]
MKFIIKMIGISLVLINISMANDTEGALPSTTNESTQKTAEGVHKNQRDYVLPFKEDRVEHRKDRRDRKENRRSNTNTTNSAETNN